MKKKVEMVMLPALGTDWTVFKNVHLGDRVFTLDMELGGAMNALNYKGQHLYATVSQDVEPIKEGDWIYDTLGGKVVQWYDGDNHDKYDRKIIATTDPKLAKSISRLLGVTQSLPQLPLSFIKKYVSNPDGEFEVEYEEYGLSLAGLPEYHSSLPDYILKLNQDNEVEMSSVEKKMYSREEVEGILYQYAEDEHGWFSSKSEIESFNKWIKNNL